MTTQTTSSRLKKTAKTATPKAAPTAELAQPILDSTDPVEPTELPAEWVGELVESQFEPEVKPELVSNRVEQVAAASVEYAAPSAVDSSAVDSSATLTDSEPVPAGLTPAIDIITGTIGGVGKTQFAHLLAGYYTDWMLKTGVLQPIHLVEGDHKGTKFYKTYETLPAPFDLMVSGLHKTVLSDDPLKQANVDFVAELALESGAPVVINTPANSAEAMTAWLINSNIPELCADAGIPLRYWFVVRNTSDSLNAFADSFRELAETVPHILVKNQFSGQNAPTGDWELPKGLQTATAIKQVPVLSMPMLFAQNQQFSESFHLPFEVARSYDPESFSFSYWQSRLAAGDRLITRWIEWTGGSVVQFVDQWQAYWQSKGLLYSGSSLAEKQQFMKQSDIPLPSVGRNRLNKFLSAGYAAVELGLTGG